MPANTEAQRRRKKDAVFSTCLHTVLELASAVLLLVLGLICEPGSFWRTLLLVFSVADLGMVIPIWISLKERLKEIEGGEEDAAAQY